MPGDRVGLIRWSRLYIGLGLIVASALLLALDNRLGLYTAAPPIPRVPPLPALGTPQRIDGRTVNVKLVARLTHVEGLSALAGHVYLLVAVRYANHTARRITVAPAAFTLTSAGATVAAQPYPGRPGALFSAPIIPGATADGYIFFLAPSRVGDARLSYRVAGASGVRTWLVP